MIEAAFVVGFLGGAALAGMWLADRLERAKERVRVLERQLLEQRGKE